MDKRRKAGNSLENRLIPPGHSPRNGAPPPPKKYRYRPGQSGNPSGRPKGRPIADDLAHILMERFGTKGDDKQSILVRRLVKAAMDGSHRAMAILIDIKGDWAPTKISPAEEKPHIPVEPEMTDEEALDKAERVIAFERARLEAKKKASACPPSCS